MDVQQMLVLREDVKDYILFFFRFCFLFKFYYYVRSLKFSFYFRKRRRNFKLIDVKCFLFWENEILIYKLRCSIFIFFVFLGCGLKFRYIVIQLRKYIKYFWSIKKIRESRLRGQGVFIRRGSFELSFMGKVRIKCIVIRDKKNVKAFLVEDYISLGIEVRKNIQGIEIQYY